MKKLLINLYTNYCKLLVHFFYPKKKELAQWNACSTKRYILFQKILNVNGMRKVDWPVHFTSIVGGKIKVGHLTSPGMMPNIYVNGINGVEFGDNVFIGPGVRIISANHDYHDYTKHLSAKPIIIGNNVWIGANAIILPEVNLADGCIVGAGSVVTKSFMQEGCIIVGNPAKIIREK